jgi:threonine aldolase
MAGNKIQKSLASDNYSGTCPEIMQALFDCNIGHEVAYGGDRYTKELEELAKTVFNQETKIFPVYNGTGANVLALKSILRSYNSVICADTAHINTSETGAPESITGTKILTIPSQNGKITISEIENLHLKSTSSSFHGTIPKVVSITNCTEFGTVYTQQEIKNISEFCHSKKMLLHVDGCRIFNACEFLNCELKDLTCDAGVDILSFGGTKNGLMFGEAVVIFNLKLAENFEYLRKNCLQLHSKMRYISAQLLTLLKDKLWLKNAKQANEMARYLASRLSEIKEINVTQKVESNHIFAIIPPKIIPELQKELSFYVWNSETSEVRLVTSWDTTIEDIDAFVTKIKDLIPSV